MKTLQQRADELNSLVERENAYTVEDGKIVYHTNFVPRRDVISQSTREELFQQDNYDLDGNPR